MGTIIKSSSVCNKGTDSSIEFAARAGRECIEKAGIDKKDIGLLINIGVQRDNNTMEPAMAPLIQQELGLNLDPVKVLQEHGREEMTFCFDLVNGSCGFISAARVADSYLKCSAVKNVLIVSSDVHPSKKMVDGYPYTHIGAAVLLTCTNDQRGFGEFKFKTSNNGYTGTDAFLKVETYGSSGRSILTLNTEADYAQMLNKFVSDTITEFFEEGKAVPGEIRLLLTSQQKSGFASDIYNTLGLNGYIKALDLYDEYGNMHSSSLAVSYDHAVNEGLVKEGEQILFAAGSAGLTSACALYIA